MSKMTTAWYMNAELLKAAKEKYKTFDRMERVFGQDRTTYAKAWKRLGLDRLSPGPAPRPLPPGGQEALAALYRDVYGSS